MILVLAIIFVVSGAAGLIYESVWSRYLGLLVGHGAYAQVIVLVIFMGGMSLGAALIARRSERLRDPLIWYAAIEGLIGIMGLGFHAVFGVASDFAYSTLFPALAGGTLLTVAKWSLAGLLIVPQSILLGATFPLMTAGGLRRLKSGDSRRESGEGRVLGILYFANSLGAAAGVLIAGFWLIRIGGLPGTLQTAAWMNIAVAIATLIVIKVEQEEMEEAPTELPNQSAVRQETIDQPQVSYSQKGTAHQTGEERSQFLWRVMLILSFGTAVASFIYEIAWIRMLSLVLGSATHAFELMLSAFILGLALGAFWIRSRADRIGDPVKLLGTVQFVMGALAIATLGIYNYAFHWMAWLFDALNSNDSGYAMYNVMRYGIALMVMLPATFCAGITLPVITKVLLGGGFGERSVGSVYAWNTLGSIVGAALAALVLMPMIGLRPMLILGGGLDIALGVGLLWYHYQLNHHPARRQTAYLASVAAVAVIIGASFSRSLDAGVLSSGVFRYGTVPDRGARKVDFYRDGRTATVSVRLGGDSAFSLATNGKPDASVSKIWFNPPPPVDQRTAMTGDESTQILLPLITLAHVPDARSAAVIGHGSGISSHILLGSDAIENLVTIDIEPQMIEASKLFRPANERVFSDPRSVFAHDDAKSYFAASGREFDLILSEPSNPWVSGVSGLFTNEFYERVRGYLTPSGVFGQWIHLYEIEDDLVLSVLNALHNNFVSYAVYQTNDVDLLIVASMDSALADPDWSVFESAGVLADLERFVMPTYSSLNGTLLLSQRELTPLLEHARVEVNSDFYPHLDLGAERARYSRGGATGFLGLTADRFDAAAALGGRVIELDTARKRSLSHERALMQELAARLYLGESPSPTDTTQANRTLQAARLRSQQLDQMLASGTPPVDWFIWFTQMVTVEHERHYGTIGVADTEWYGRVERYMSSQGAPRDGLAAVRFLRAAVSYDWDGAAAEIDDLLQARSMGRHWLPAGLFFDATVIARLKVDDVAGARAAFARLSTTSNRNARDLRTLLLDGHIKAAEKPDP